MARNRARDSLPSHGDESGDRRLDDLLAQYIDRLNAGERLDREQIEADHPDLAAALLESLETFAQMAKVDEEGGPRTLGDYTLRRQIGQGGMGIVYDAWQNSMNRRVALKVLPVGISADPKSCARFMREAQAAGRLIKGKDGQFADRSFRHPDMFSPSTPPNLYAPGPRGQRHSDADGGGGLAGRAASAETMARISSEALLSSMKKGIRCQRSQRVGSSAEAGGPASTWTLGGTKSRWTESRWTISSLAFPFSDSQETQGPPAAKPAPAAKNEIKPSRNRPSGTGDAQGNSATRRYMILEASHQIGSGSPLHRRCYGIWSSISGGNSVSGNRSAISGGQFNTASGYGASVSGGERNSASGDSSSASGGYNRSVIAQYDWIAGDRRPFELIPEEVLVGRHGWPSHPLSRRPCPVSTATMRNPLVYDVLVETHRHRSEG